MSIITLFKDKKFQETMISVILILTLLYEGFSVMLYFSSGETNYINILSLPSTMFCIVMVPLLFVAWKIMKGGKVNLPVDFISKPKQQTPEQPTFLEVKPQPIQGTWTCSCGNLAKGNLCNSCGRNKP